MKFKSKPVEIEAIQFKGLEGDNKFEIAAWMLASKNKDVEACRFDNENGTLLIDTREGTTAASPGDWIIKGTIGEFYPCKDEVFKIKYEAI